MAYEHLDTLRVVLFTPYRVGMGPRFVLRMWATSRVDWRGQTRIGYQLTMRETGKPPVVLFTGEDFCASPMHADDSNAAVEGLMSFLMLRDGGTDDEYFEDYTPEQLAYCEAHAEALNGEVSARFCCDNCGAVRERRKSNLCNRCKARRDKS